MSTKDRCNTRQCAAVSALALDQPDEREGYYDPDDKQEQRIKQVVKPQSFPWRVLELSGDKLADGGEDRTLARQHVPQCQPDPVDADDAEHVETAQGVDGGYSRRRGRGAARVRSRGGRWSRSNSGVVQGGAHNGRLAEPRRVAGMGRSGSAPMVGPAFFRKLHALAADPALGDIAPGLPETPSVGSFPESGLISSARRRSAG